MGRINGEMFDVDIILEFPVCQEGEEIIATVVIDKAREFSALHPDEIGHMFGVFEQSALVGGKCLVVQFQESRIVFHCQFSEFHNIII